MSYSIAKSSMIDYPPETLAHFVVTGYEWIDNLNFVMDPAECLENVDDYLEIACERFVEAGWAGDGLIGLMWVPPFAFPVEQQAGLESGLILWHVKQDSDGVSWLLHPDLAGRTLGF